MQINSSAKVEQSIRLEYEKRYELFKPLEQNVLDLIEKACKEKKWIFVHRVKELESYALKLLTGRTQQYEIDDFLACTIVVPSLRDVDSAKTLVNSCFTVITEKPDEYVQSRPTEFNFDGIRLYCRLKASVKKNELDNLDFEIQVKTLLDYAWSEATHDFSYKGGSVSWAKERLATQLKATLNSIDLSIYDMETISNSPFLNKKNKKYEQLAEVLCFLKDNFVNKYKIAVPEDVKRLSEEVNRFLRRTNITLLELEQALDEDTKSGGGYKILNLSVYSIILVALFKHKTTKVTDALKCKPEKKEPKIVIPYETSLKSTYEGLGLKNVDFL